MKNILQLGTDAKNWASRCLVVGDDNFVIKRDVDIAGEFGNIRVNVSAILFRGIRGSGQVTLVRNCDFDFKIKVRYCKLINYLSKVYFKLST